MTFVLMPQVGESVERYSKRVATLADVSGAKVVGEFHGTKIICRPGQDAAYVWHLYHAIKEILSSRTSNQP
jgi:hypothetical protein